MRNATEGLVSRLAWAIRALAEGTGEHEKREGRGVVAWVCCRTDRIEKDAGQFQEVAARSLGWSVRV